MNPLDPTSLSPVLRTLRGFLHALVGVLLLVVVVRAMRPTGSSPSLGIVWAAAAMAVIYAAGALMPVVKRSVHAAAVWLAVLLAAWLWLVILTPDAVWLAFPLFFLELHLAGRWGLPAVVVTTLVAVGGTAWHADGPQMGGVLGPAIGAAVVVATVRGYEALHRESDQRRLLIAELTATRNDLAHAERAAGVLAERERLAREIHDTLAQGLSSIQLLLRAAERTIHSDPDTARQQVVTAREAAVTNLAEARRFVHDWTPPDLESGSLRHALEQLCQRTTASSGIPVDLTVSGTVVPLPTGHEVALLRVAQQAIANAIQHADAHHIHLTLSYMDTEIVLDAVDDGRGFDNAYSGAVPAPIGTRDGSDGNGARGFGLAAMRARAAALNGTLAIESAAGRGTAVAVTLPLPGGQR
ncbi:sensor histidine kinase [uncultured Cellulomonas sp.]|uniref:sensor histidine kinase n=1 Tax=uncultured Cellulomonas sp. TaxID=189682 RepID=UPI002626EDBD|nr:sensor histidine kinase [uncultured Cellulomonas sp.]